ncbi:MAG: NAD(P)/FAD-dependent oxidoreductase [Bacteroidota bacterium]
MPVYRMIHTIIIGGGAAGFFAAIALAKREPKSKVIILERGKSVLEKVRISGGGRCNVTHACWTPRELIAHYPRGSKELLGPFNKFACGDTMAWFEDRGVALKIEEDGRVFPTTDDSSTIIDCLWQTAKGLGVEVLTRHRVDNIIHQPKEDLAWRVTCGDQQFNAHRLVVATGSNPAAWRLLDQLGLRLVPPVPSLFAFNVADKALRNLAGISLPWAQVWIKGHQLKAEGPLLITHKGLSGPAVLRLSAWGARELAPTRYRFQLGVNWLCQKTEHVEQQLHSLRQEFPKQTLGSHARFELPLRLWRLILERASLSLDFRWSEASNKHLRQLAHQLTRDMYPVDGKATNKDEFVTAGGVDLKEIDFKDFSAKRFPNLHLAGEVLDIDAITGGFNFQAAWTGGYLIAGSG